MAKPKTGGLGRGLSSLLPDAVYEPQPVAVRESSAAEKKGTEAAAASDGNSVVYLKLGDIKPNSMQPRKNFSEESLEELAASIKEYGVIQPVIVRTAAKGYELVAGERRWRAARKAGLKTVPAIIRELDDRENAFLALVENMQREDLNSIDEALGIQEIITNFGLTQEEAAKVVGRSRPYIANSLRLLRLPEEVQAMVIDGRLSAGHARAIAGLSGAAVQKEAAEKAVKLGWNVRQIESFTGEKAPKRKNPKKSKAGTGELARIENALSEKIGTKININGNEKKGKIELEYYSREELERLIELLEAAKAVK